jgi:aminoglycoside 3-N-acetyltransferase
MNFSSIPSKLKIKKGDTLFIHSSSNFLNANPSDCLRIIETFLEAVSDSGSIFMPSYIWRGPPGYPNEGEVFDVKNSYSKVGLLSEIFRRTEGVHRSLHYWVPICGIGPKKYGILNNQEKVVHPFGKNSSHRKLLESEAKVVGLGVSLNTSSLSHLVDYSLNAQYPFKVFTDFPIKGKVIDYESKTLNTKTIIVRPKVINSYKPSLLIKESQKLQDELIYENHENKIYFSYSIKTYYDEGLKIGKNYLSQKAIPPWLNNAFL